jgi:hypothetical protein
LEGLVHIIARQPKLSRDGVAVLVEVGEAIHESSTREEQTALLRHTTAQEVYVRNAVLQALQPFDLTDIEWSPEVLIACHDDDEQNGRLARQLCDENGLEIPEGYMSSLIPLLGECQLGLSSTLTQNKTTNTVTCARVVLARLRRRLKPILVRGNQL